MKIKNITLSLLAAWLLTACTDDTTYTTAGEATVNLDFCIGVEEVADAIYEMGKTRADGSPAIDAATIAEANATRSIPLEGSDELYIHRMPLPLVGIHPGTAGGEALNSQPSSLNSQHSALNSRAPLSEIAESGIAFHDSLSIWGYTSGRTGGDLTLLNGTTVLKVNGFRTACEWPYADAGTMRFYAIAPAKESLGEAISGFNSPAYATAPTFTYTVPNAPAEQRDLLYGSSAIIDIATPGMDKDHIGVDNRVVGMSFRHILTAVRFAQGKMPTNVTIKSITLTGIKNSGSYDGTAWSGQTGTATYTINPNHDVTAYHPENVYIDGDSVLFLMPHTLAAPEKLEVVLRKDGETADRHLSVALTGDLWLPGYTVTYKITIGEMASSYYLLVGASPGTTSTQNEHEGTDASNQTFTVHSYHNYIDYSESETGVTVAKPVSWKVSKYSDDGNAFESDKPTTLSWLTVSDASSSHIGGMNQTLTYSVAAQSPAYILDHKDILGSNNINNVEHLDLSCYRPTGNGFEKLYSSAANNGSTNQPYQTANCYIVNCAGTYYIPLVYGNAYEGSTTAKTGATLNPNGIFKDHANRTIEYAHIIDQVHYITAPDPSAAGETPTTEDIAVNGCSDATKTLVATEILYNNVAGDYKAELVWQDVDGQFTMTTTGGGIVMTPTNSSPGYLGFTVNSNPKPGNCVIAFMGKKTTKTIRRMYNGTTYLGERVVSTTTAEDFEILWTWHIWCTDEVLPNNNTKTINPESGSAAPTLHVDLLYPSYDGENYSKIPKIENYADTKTSIMPVPLGWVPNPDGDGNYKTNIYRQRKGWIELEQEEPADGTKQTARVIVQQEWSPQLQAGTTTIYQWGRPTALPMVLKYDVSDFVTRTIYNRDGNDITADFSGRTISNIGEMVLYPKNIVGRGNTSDWWNTAVLYDFWGTGTDKTIYDPCPTGFRLPAQNNFTGFSTTGGKIDGGTKLNMWDATAPALRYGVQKVGGYVYAKKHTSVPIPADDRYGTMVFMPCNGYWSGSDVNGKMMTAIQKYGSSCYSWTYEKDGTKGGKILEICPDKSSQGDFFSDESNPYADAMPIRPRGE